MKRTFSILSVITLTASLIMAPTASAGESNQADRLVSRIERAMGQRDGKKQTAEAVGDLWAYAEENPANAFEELRTALLDRGFTEAQINRVLELEPRLQQALAIGDPQKQTKALNLIVKDVGRMLPAETGSMSRVCWPFLVPAAAGAALLIAGIAKDKTGLVIGGLVSAVIGIYLVRMVGC